MKDKIIFITLLLFFQSGFSYSQIVLDIQIRDCRTKSNLDNPTNFRLYKDKKIYGEFETEYKNKKSISLKKKGKYIIEYKTKFGITETTYVDIKEKKRYKIDLCLEYMDYSKERYIPLITQLKNGEKYTIDYSSQSSYLSSKKSIIIRKRQNLFFISSGEKEMQLSLEQIESLRHFEIELSHMSKPDCTNIDTYTLSYKDKIIKINDGSCWWYGGEYLLKELGYL
jgi:hypothetical protein